jgi:hypothetical protein
MNRDGNQVLRLPISGGDAVCWHSSAFRVNYAQRGIIQYHFDFQKNQDVKQLIYAIFQQNGFCDKKAADFRQFEY